MYHFLFFLLGSLLTISIAQAQSAELRIKNTSDRMLTVKVMNSNNGRLFKKFIVYPRASYTEYFATTGSFFLKTKAEYPGREPVYEKGNPFRVYVGTDGYSVLTITYAIQESNVANPLEGKSISRQEFERDN
ncbi:hypothetical protein [Rhodoflexus caldus]|uniref:hypothetical protein n=1 Tax=Rhodoflexus caldus TaxID=2891236 RepID=UPI002029FDDB|nr:hypothetical protein [Rhodoflexus caldus]